MQVHLFFSYTEEHTACILHPGEVTRKEVHFFGNFSHTSDCNYAQLASYSLDLNPAKNADSHRYNCWCILVLIVYSAKI